MATKRSKKGKSFNVRILETRTGYKLGWAMTTRKTGKNTLTWGDAAPSDVKRLRAVIEAR